MESLRTSLPPNPRDKANFVSVLIFWWTIDLFKKGYRKVLQLEDLFKPINVDRSEALGDRLERKWKKQLNGPGRPNLIKAIVYTFWREYTYLGVIHLINEVFIRLGQPILLGKLLMYFRKGSNMSREDALYAAGGIVFLNALSVLTINQYVLSAFHNGMKVRVAVCSIIYRKAISLSRTALGDTAPGKVVNLLSNDVNRFDIVSVFLHSMWSAPLLSIVVAFLLYSEIGFPAIVGIIVVFFVVPLQSYTGKLSSRFRLQTALRTDERVRFMDEIISGVQVIKMYAWEIPFSKLIALARRMELKIVKKNSYVRGLYMTFLLFTTRMALFCTMMTIVLIGDKLTAVKVFVVSAYFNILANTMSQMFVRGVAEIAEALVAFKRLQNFLEYEEKTIYAINCIKEKEFNDLNLNGDIAEKEKLLDTELPSDVAISIKNGTARWIMPKNKTTKYDKIKEKKEFVQDKEVENAVTLSDINIDFKKGMLIGIVGPVGAGKSSLLELILRELPLESGTININGSVAYACQEPWVFAATVKQNILFGHEMNKELYESTIKTCALTTDLEQFPYGDKTIIGERGASLSGGQKARISLARAVYRQTSICLFDDPLSAVDAHVGRHLFETCIGPKGRLAKKGVTRILVTHQVHFLKEADWVVVLRDGKIEMQGSPQNLSKSGVDFAKLLEIDENEEVDNELIGGLKRRLSSKSSTSSQSSLKENLGESSDDNKNDDNIKKSVEDINQNIEQSSKGTVRGSIAGNYLKAGANPFVLLIILLLFLGTQIIASAADFWVAFWTSQEELRDFYKQSDAVERVASNLTDELELPSFNYTTISSIANDFLKKMSDIMEEHATINLLTTNVCMYIHGSLMAGLFIFAIVRSFSFYSICVTASQTLHDGMFKGVISTTMRFFDTNPSGRILNRFSKDMGATDELLPKAILDAVQIILSMVGSIIVTIIVDPLFLLPVGVMFVIFMYIRKIYLKTSKNIKRLEGITRSPVFTHLSATLMGLPTIRAFNAEQVLIKEFDGHQDLHSAAWYMFITTSTAFGFALDLLCLIFVFIVTFSFLLINQDILGDRVGLAITQAMALTGMMQWGIRQSAEVVNQLMSVERLLEYRDLNSETQPIKPKVITKTWPENGCLEFKNVIYSYFDGAEPVLRNLSFTIQPREKIGIVGRTGAGKSSLIGAIFRLAQVRGEIIIDGIDTGTILLQQLRSKVSIIPQDPVLFSGTLRRNLDPFDEYPDADLWKALDEVELKDITGALGLQTAVLAGGSNFSVGQRQLVCLARAILRDNKLLVLDEATANVDPHTDELIQQTIRTRFENCTVLTVAHRLHTIMDSDRVILMSAGEAVEYDAPYKLLQNPNSLFKQMVATCGQQEQEYLTKVAKDAYEKNKMD